MESFEELVREMKDEVRLMAEVAGLFPSAEEEDRGEPKDAWPVLEGEALHGIAGQVVRAIEPHTEADPVSLLVHTLAEFGCMIGRGPHLKIGATYHPLLFYPVPVGKTSKGRKGESADRIADLFSRVDPTWTRGFYKGTLSSGEGLTFAVRDPEFGQDKSGNEIVLDEGVTDKRLFLVQSEFGSVLRVMARDGNQLSGTIRDAWDGKTLAPMTKSNRIRASFPHIAIVGHVTEDELLRHLTDTEASNGFGNRFAYFLVKRSKELPFPTELDAPVMGRLVTLIRNSFEVAREVDQIGMTEAAKETWRAAYHDLSAERPGLAGALLNRSEAYVLRLAAIYALFDCKNAIDVDHLTAAMALWEYSERSTYLIFGARAGDPIADQIEEAIRKKGEMTDTEISALFKRNQTAARLWGAKARLQKAGRIISSIRETKGRRETIWMHKTN